MSLVLYAPTVGIKWYKMACGRVHPKQHTYWQFFGVTAEFIPPLPFQNGDLPTSQKGKNLWLDPWLRCRVARPCCFPSRAVGKTQRNWWHIGWGLPEPWSFPRFLNPFRCLRISWSVSSWNTLQWSFPEVSWTNPNLDPTVTDFEPGSSLKTQSRDGPALGQIRNIESMEAGPKTLFGWWMLMGFQ